MSKYNVTEGKRHGGGSSCNIIGPQVKEELRLKVIKAMEEDKVYHNECLTSRKLAELLGTNTRYVSAVVNDCFGMSFTSFINKYRIEEAKSLLRNPRYAATRMEDIGKMVGYGNRQSFYASFYRLEDTTPREYRNRVAGED